MRAADWVEVLTQRQVGSHAHGVGALALCFSPGGNTPFQLAVLTQRVLLVVEHSVMAALAQRTPLLARRLNLRR